MGIETGISWTDHTFNPWWGCTKVSQGCKHCYAETLSKRFGDDIWGVGKQRKTFGTKHWQEPLKWNKDAAAANVRRRVFCASMADVFEDGLQLDDERDKLWDLIEATPQLDWLLLTKRPENIEGMLPAAWLTLPRHNVWLGTTAESQPAADRRIPVLLQVPAVVRFASVEPMITAVDLVDNNLIFGMHWVICGGESGKGARPMPLEWARDLRDQCQAADVAFFMKQLGGEYNKRGKLEDLPEDLRIREFPYVLA